MVQFPGAATVRHRPALPKRRRGPVRLGRDRFVIPCRLEVVLDTPVNPVVTSEWSRAARRELLALRGTSAAWSYRNGSKPAVESTALAGLGLLASTDASRAQDPDSVTRPAADWLASIQNADGSLGIAAEQPSPRWTTPYALLLWNALTGFEKPRRGAVAWLLREKGRAIPPESDSDHIVGHDTSLIGWPWVSDTHSWLEPTAMAVLALGREGYGDHGRVREGVRLILDRALPDGGWNYGNKAVFGTPLRPQPAPTGLALLALAQAEAASSVVARGIRYLLEILPNTRAPAAIGWGLLGLRSWNRAPAEASVWLAEAYRQAAGRPDAAPRISLLLLAGGDASLALLAGDHKGERRG
jgi:hypothetical protein